MAAPMPSKMVYGELGKCPLEINGCVRAIKYWPTEPNTPNVAKKESQLAFKDQINSFFGDYWKISVLIETLLCVFGSCACHSELAEEM